MKKIEAYIKPQKLSEVSMALRRVPGLTGMSVSEIRGWGRGKQQADQRDRVEQASEFEHHTKIEIVCPDGLLDEVVETIQQTARTGLVGDGAIVVSTVERVVRISTGERCAEAIEGDTE